MGLAALEDILRNKLMQKSKRASDEHSTVKRLFDNPAQGITPQLFRKVLAKLDMPIGTKKALALFSQYDAHGNGIISCNEFIRAILPKDYPGGANAWFNRRQTRRRRHETRHHADHGSKTGKRRPRLTRIRGNTPNMKLST